MVCVSSVRTQRVTKAVLPLTRYATSAARPLLSVCVCRVRSVVFACTVPRGASVRMVVVTSAMVVLNVVSVIV